MVLQTSPISSRKYGRSSLQHVRHHLHLKVLLILMCSTTLFTTLLFIDFYRGNLFQAQKRFKESLEAYDRAIYFRPQLAGKLRDSRKSVK